MNFFKLYIGDYQRDTGTLSIAEHGAYFLLLQHYYATEAELPKGRELYRLLRCESKSDRDAVDAVLAKFWRETETGYTNDRAIKEIVIERRKLAALKDLQERDEYRKYRDMVIARDRQSCIYCGATGVRLQLDHVIPRSRGGVDTPDNLVACCKPCNTSKGARTPDEWRALQ